jgi:hypothetical protein
MRRYGHKSIKIYHQVENNFITFWLTIKKLIKEYMNRTMGINLKGKDTGITMPNLLN